MTEHYRNYFEGEDSQQETSYEELGKYYHKVNRIEDKLKQIKQELLRTEGSCDNLKLENMLKTLANITKEGE